MSRWWVVIDPTGNPVLKDGKPRLYKSIRKACYGAEFAWRRENDWEWPAKHEVKGYRVAEMKIAAAMTVVPDDWRWSLPKEKK